MCGTWPFTDTYPYGNSNADRDGEATWETFANTGSDSGRYAYTKWNTGCNTGSSDCTGCNQCDQQRFHCPLE